MIKEPTSPASLPLNRMQDAQKLPNGARFYRCALQVNPFSYLETYKKKSPFKSEVEYNKAIINACFETGIEVIAVTDHYRVKHSVKLVCAARDAGIAAFLGFEACTKDGVHFLCLFDPDKEVEVLERYIGECGIYDTDQPSEIGNKDSSELPEKAKDWGAVFIAAHVASNGGLLKVLSGQSRVKAWKNPALLACALPGPVTDAPYEDGIRRILENKEAQYKRERLPAILNTSDINHPEDLKKNRASCFIKMSTISVEGFRQAFLDPDSRIRLHSDQKLDSHAEFLAMTWEGGFLNDTAVHFNENLNVLIGGRGTGKSTMIESIRYALSLDPVGEEAQKVHKDVIRHVLKPGTKVSLLMRSHKPSERCYTIERTVPNPPIVKDEKGNVLTVSPSDVMPNVEVFGQHEISELTKSPDKLTRLLERFVDRDPSRSGQKLQVRLGLERSRSQIMNVRHEIERLEEQLTALPSLQETQRRFKQAGIEDRLKEKSLLIREERLFSNLDERVNQYHSLHNELTAELPVDTVLVSSKALEGLPNADILSEIKETLETLSKNLKAVDEQFDRTLTEADRAIETIKLRWNGRKITIEETYENTLRKLQKSKVNGEEFIQLRQQIEELHPLKNKAEKLRRELKEYETQRRNFLAEWEDIKAEEYRQLETAAKRASKNLCNRVQVKVTMAGNRQPLEQLLRDKVRGMLSPALECLRRQDQLSLQELAQQCREGKDALMNRYDIPPGAAERIAEAEPDLFMNIEELDLPATTEIELNTAPDGEPVEWKKLNTLSTGQKATAVLLFLLLESDTPLIVDQPEDDLDNRFITESVVPIIRQEKNRRQFVFSTHNANIPVLGDAELILGLTAAGEAKEGYARIDPKHMGSIDSKPVRDLIKETLEGGKSAFEMRRSKYGF